MKENTAMTKEEILKNVSTYDIGNGEKFYHVYNVLQAMQEYAEQEKEKEAVAFAEWLEFNGWRACYMVNHWDNIFTKLDYPKPTTELYKIYKK